MEARTNIELVKGQDANHEFAVRDGDGALLNLTGYGAELKAYTPDGVLVFDFSDGVEIAVDPAGKLVVSFTAADTVNATWSIADYRMFIISGVGARYQVARGRITIWPDYS